MALSLGQTGTADPIEAEYFNWDSPNEGLRVHMHLDAVDGMARDVIEGFKALPRRGVEVGGLLLGRVEPGSRRTVWIERYQRIECGHRFGPQFVLDDEEHAALEQAAASLSDSSELNIVGYYRSHTRPGLQLEDADVEILDRYFRDAGDLALLIRPENLIDISALFFSRDASGELSPAGPVFPFRGRALGPLAGPPENAGNEAPERDVERVAEPVSTWSEPEPPPAPPRERMRRLVPDFAPEPPRPVNEYFGDPRSIAPPNLVLEPEISPLAEFARKWWPLAAALLLVGGAVFFLLQQQRPRDVASTPPSQAGSAESGGNIRPLGLYVDPSGNNWRISWNPSAIAMRGARNVALFVRDGEDQNRIDLTTSDLQSGTYQYQPKGPDVTFRLEVTDSTGHLSAESFRFMKTPPPTPAPATSPVESRPAAIRARAIHRVAPVVPASIRPRIRGKIPIDVRVHINARGRVTSASPVTRPHGGLESYLAGRAVYAAKLWRFEPVRENGKPVPGTEVIHFEFER